MSLPPPLAYPHPGPPPELPELPEGAPPPAPRSPRWPAWTAPVALVAGFGGAIVGYLVVAIVAGAAGSNIDDPPAGVEIGGTVVQDAALVISALLFARLSQSPRPWHFGLRRTRIWRAAGFVAIAWLGFIVFSAIWVAALRIHERDDLPKELGAGNSTVALAAVALLVTVVAPVAEEFFFRGYFFTALRAWRGVWPAAIITGLVFGGIHAGSAPVGFLAPLAFFGFLLCLLYWRTGSLYPCIVLHCLNNSLAFGVSEGWDWQVPLLMVGANLAIAAALFPLARSWGRGLSSAAAPA